MPKVVFANDVFCTVVNADWRLGFNQRVEHAVCSPHREALLRSDAAPLSLSLSLSPPPSLSLLPGCKHSANN
jgi:hypothetical protein